MLSANMQRWIIPKVIALLSSLVPRQTNERDGKDQHAGDAPSAGGHS
jgi:hypothetical protein